MNENTFFFLVFSFFFNSVDFEEGGRGTFEREPVDLLPFFLPFLFFFSSVDFEEGGRGIFERESVELLTFFFLVFSFFFFSSVDFEENIRSASHSQKGEE